MNYVGNEPAPAGLVLVGDTNPVGSIVWGHKVPDGSYLRLNGQIVSKTTYADLWAYASAFVTADQTANPGLYRSVDASTFAVPNMAGLFVRGQGTWDANRTSGALGARQDDNNKAHTHSQDPSTSGSTGLIGGGVLAGSAQTGSSGGTEARPINVALIPSVKALASVLMPSTAMPTIPSSSYDFLAEVVAASSASLTFTGLNSSSAAYSSYALQFMALMPSANDAGFNMRWSHDGVTFASGASDYWNGYSYVQGGAVTGANPSGSFFGFTGAYSNGVGNGGMSGTMTITNISLTSSAAGLKAYTSHMGGYRSSPQGTNVLVAAGMCNNTALSAATLGGITIIPNAGTIASGKIRLYGIR